MPFIAGPYTATYRGQALGQAAEGYRVSHQFFKRIITGDSYAEGPQDEVYRGMEMFVNFRCIEYDAAGITALAFPFANRWNHGLVGRVSKQQGLCGALVLTAIAGTPAANAPASLTLTNCILAEGFPVELLFAPDLREVPVKLRAYPTQNNGIFGTET